MSNIMILVLGFSIGLSAAAHDNSDKNYMICWLIGVILGMLVGVLTE